MNFGKFREKPSVIIDECYIDISHIKRIRKTKHSDQIQILVGTTSSIESLEDKSESDQFLGDIDKNSSEKVCVQPIFIKKVFDEMT